MNPIPATQQNIGKEVRNNFLLARTTALDGEGRRNMLPFKTLFGFASFTLTITSTISIVANFPGSQQDEPKPTHRLLILPKTHPR
jgi:hypothetical protein